MSRTGDEAGYTLTELLVALAIISLLAVMIPVGYRAAIPGAQLSHTRTQALSLLREARTLARGSSENVGVELSDGRLALDAEDQSVSWGENVAVTYLPAFAPDGLETDEAAEEILFFPDGSSTGGVLTFENGAASRSITIHWLFGDVQAN